MREKLKPLVGLRCPFRAQFVRFGQKSAYKGPPIITLLFRDIRDARNLPVCDHVWFRMGKGFAALDLHEGDWIAFRATPREYTKGYRGRRDDEYDDRPAVSTDYGLSYPGELRKLTPENLPAPPPPPPSGAPAAQLTLF